MTRRQTIRLLSGWGLLACSPWLIAGCNPDDGQPAPGSIVTPPRDNAGPRAGIDEKVRSKPGTKKAGN